MTPTQPKDAEANAEAKQDEVEPEVLDLMDLAPTRRLVKVPTKAHPEGEAFPMRLVDDFGIEDQQKLMSWSRRFQELMSKNGQMSDDGETLSDKERTRLRFLLDNLFDMVLDAPASVKKTMNDTVRNRVVTAFSWAPVLARQEQQTALVQRLVEKEYVTQEQVDEVMAELRAEMLTQMQSRSTTAN